MATEQFRPADVNPSHTVSRLWTRDGIWRKTCSAYTHVATNKLRADRLHHWSKEGLLTPLVQGGPTYTTGPRSA